MIAPVTLAFYLLARSPQVPDPRMPPPIVEKGEKSKPKVDLLRVLYTLEVAPQDPRAGTVRVDIFGRNVRFPFPFLFLFLFLLH